MSGDRAAAEALTEIEQWVAVWESEAAERGPDDTLYTAGVAATLRRILDRAARAAATKHEHYTVREVQECVACDDEPTRSQP